MISIKQPLPLEKIAFIFFFVWSLAQISIFWLDLFRILVFANAILFLILTLYYSSKRTKIPTEKKIIFSYICIYFFLALSCFWAPDPEDSLENFGRTIASALPAFFAAELLARRCNLLSIFYGMTLLTVAIFIQSIYNLYLYEDAAIFGEYSIRTVAGNILCVLIPISFGMFYFNRSKYFLIIFFMCILNIIFLSSRTGIISVFIGIFSVLLINNFKRTFWITFAASPLFLLPILFFNFSDEIRFGYEDTSFEIGESVIADFGVDKSLRVDFDRRLHTFAANEMFELNPIFGGGYGSIYQDTKYKYDIAIPAHGFLGTFAETGIVGLSIFLIFLYFIFIRYFEIYKNLKLKILDMDIIIISALIVSIFVGFFHQVFESPFFSMILGIITGRLSRDNTD